MAVGRIMASDIQPIVYKGHGRLEIATPGQSISHVINHEYTHHSEYENYAKANDLEITAKEIDIFYEYRDGKLIAVAGKAKATFEKKEDKGKQNADGDSVEIGGVTGNSSINGSNNINSQLNESSETKKATYSLETIKANLTAKKQQLETKVKQADNGEDTLNSGNTFNSTDKKKIEGKKEKLEKKIKQVDAIIEQVHARETMNDIFTLFNKADAFAVKIGKISAGNLIAGNGLKAYQRQQSQSSRQVAYQGLSNDVSNLISGIVAGGSLDFTV